MTLASKGPWPMQHGPLTKPKGVPTAKRRKTPRVYDFDNRNLSNTKKGPGRRHLQGKREEKAS